MTDIPAPIGLGFRVPLLIISPWTRGNIVISEIFDHTSVIQFIEKRFNVLCENISPWRRAMTGDLTSAFDFNNPDYTWPDLPDTSNYTRESVDECRNLPYPEVPSEQVFPVQEIGVRISRALPYQFTTSDIVGDNMLVLVIANEGISGAPFVLYDHLKLGQEGGIRKYAIEGGKRVQDNLLFSSNYHFSLYGANGYFRDFRGTSADKVFLSASLLYDVSGRNVIITLQNRGVTDVTCVVSDTIYNNNTQEVTVSGGQRMSREYNVEPFGNWYDITVEASNSFARRFAGRMETGKDTISDPAMAASAPSVNQKHPMIPEKYRIFPRVYDSSDKASHKDALWNFRPNEL